MYLQDFNSQANHKIVFVAQLKKLSYHLEEMKKSFV